MAEILAFRAVEKAKPGRPAPARTEADDAHDAATWMTCAENWGWTALEFTAEDDSVSGLLLLHDAADDKKPLFTLVRGEGTTWRMWNRHRKLTEFDALYDALQAVFPTLLVDPPRRHR